MDIYLNPFNTKFEEVVNSEILLIKQDLFNISMMYCILPKNISVSAALDDLANLYQRM